MSFQSSKVAIIGTGAVGATTAYSLINQGLCQQILLVGRNKEKAYGEALDMQHSVAFMSRNITVTAGDYSDCGDADIVVIAASAPMPRDSHDRLEMLTPSMQVIKSIVQPIMDSGFHGIFLVVSNPVDIMTYLVWRLSGLPRNQVIGSGTALDSARLRCELGRLYDLDAKSVEAFIIGEHGDSSVISWSTATIGGKRAEDVLADNTDRTRDATVENLLQKTKKAGWEIFGRKGNTCYGIAAANAAIIKSILFNENRILPVSVCLEGQYGLHDLYFSLPAILNCHGAKEIVQIRLNDVEREALMQSAQVIRSFYKDLGI